MARDDTVRRTRRWYARLLRLYPKPYRERFGESMEQTFADVLRERAETDGRLLACALGMFAETSAAILRENVVQYGSIVRIALGTAVLLMLPLLAMQLTDEVAWDFADFAVAGVLLSGAGLVFERIAKKGGTTAYRAATGIAVATALLIVWMNLAVGILGSEDNLANLIYVGVLAIGILGALVARFRPRGMALALFATALAQVSVGVIALIAGAGFALMLNGLFVGLWVGAALLFRRAAIARSA